MRFGIAGARSRRARGSDRLLASDAVQLGMRSAVALIVGPVCLPVSSSACWFLALQDGLWRAATTLLATEGLGVGDLKMVEISQIVLFILADAFLYGLVGFLFRDQITIFRDQIMRRAEGRALDQNVIPFKPKEDNSLS